MRKFLLLLGCLAVMFSAAAAEQSTTVVFKSEYKTDKNGKVIDSSYPLKEQTPVSDFLTSGANLFSSVKSAQNAFVGVYGLKLSSSKKAGSLELNFAEQLNLTKVVVKARNWNNPNDKDSSTTKFDAGTIQVNDATAQDLTDVMADYTFDIKGQMATFKISATKRAYIESVTFYYDQEGPAVIVPETPTFSVQGEAATEDVTVTLACATEGAKIYYTLDGTNPTAESTEYTAPFVVKYEDGTVTVKAIAILNDVLSPVASETFTRPDLAYDSLAKLIEENPLPESGKNSDTFLVNFDMTVTYANGRNIYVYADGEYSLIYANAAIDGLKTGDVIKGGWLGHVSNYNLIYGIVPEKGQTLTVDGTAILPTPESVTVYNLTSADVNKQLIMEKVVFTDATPNDKKTFTGKMDETDVAFYNQFTLPSVEAGTYNVEVIVAIFKGNIQLYPISYSVSTGINEVETAEKAEYFNLQGVKVVNPEAGLYIVKRGNKVYKTVIK